MKRLITALFVLLAGLSFVSAAEADNATGGIIAIDAGLGSPVARIGFFDIYGSDFSMIGQFGIDPTMNDFGSVGPGMPFHFSFTQETLSCGVTSSPLVVSLTVQGVEWGGSGSCATLTVTGQTPPPNAGYYSGTFSLDSSFEGGNFPFAVSGGGTFFLIIPPGTSYASVAELFVQPSAVPEPSTMSLVLVGFAGLALIGRRRRSLNR
jgi:hypothetical protein